MIFWHRGGSRQVSDVSYTMGDSVTNISGDPDMMLMEECRECLIFSNQRHYENWHCGGFETGLRCLLRPGGRRREHLHRPRHDADGGVPGVFDLFQSTSLWKLTLWGHWDRSQMSRTPWGMAWTATPPSSTCWSLGGGGNHWQADCWQHHTCTRVFKTIFSWLDYFLCWEICLDINQTDLQMWCCFDLHLADRSHQSSHLSLTQVISDILALSQQ